MPLSLSDDELQIIQDCARPLPPEDRAKFVEAVAGELEKYRELGPGLVSRVSRELQRQHFNPPSFRGDGFAKYGRQEVREVSQRGHAVRP